MRCEFLRQVFAGNLNWETLALRMVDSQFVSGDADTARTGWRKLRRAANVG